MRALTTVVEVRDDDADSGHARTKRGMEIGAKVHLDEQFRELRFRSRRNRLKCAVAMGRSSPHDACNVLSNSSENSV